jgi:RNA polymerase sigma-70 factor (ECF subfamily)
MAKYNSDDDLIQAARQGDATAFDQLQQRHWSWVYRLLVVMVHDDQQAEDLAQEAFYRVYRHLHEYTAGGQFVAWVKRIAINLAKNWLRDQRRALRMVQVEAEGMDSGASHLDPQVIFASHLLRQEIRTALRTLNNEQQRVLLLYYFSGMSVETIAARLQCSVGTVKSRLFYGRCLMRQALLAIWEATYNHKKGVSP